MKANFFYSDLNPCGGGERLTLITMKAVFEMGIDIYFTTLEIPDLSKLENAFGINIVSILKNIKKIKILQILDEQSIKKNIEEEKYDIVINTHGDIDPYYDDSLSKDNTITYCHFPSAKNYIQNENKTYLERHLKIKRALSPSPTSYSSKTNSTNATATNSINIVQDNATLKNFDLKQHLKWLKETYNKMMKNTTLVTNSEYSGKAIFKEYGIKDSIVLYPPVDIEKFSILSSSNSSFNNTNNTLDRKREDIVLVVSRIDPSKEIENAINLANLLKTKGIAKKMIIVGGLDLYFNDYYSLLKKMILDFGLIDYIQFEINIAFDKLLLNMKKSKVYFHPRSGEHFGISIVEAMSAGLIPVVADKGGQTEFIASKYQYSNLGQASQIVSVALNASDEERVHISDSVQKFSISNYMKNFQQIVKDILLQKKSSWR